MTKSPSAHIYAPVRLIANISAWLGRIGRIGDRYRQMQMWKALDYQDGTIENVNWYILTGRGWKPLPLIPAQTLMCTEEVRQDAN